MGSVLLIFAQGVFGGVRVGLPKMCLVGSVLVYPRCVWCGPCCYPRCVWWGPCWFTHGVLGGVGVVTQGVFGGVRVGLPKVCLMGSVLLIFTQGVFSGVRVAHLYPRCVWSGPLCYPKCVWWGPCWLTQSVFGGVGIGLPKVCLVGFVLLIFTQGVFGGVRVAHLYPRCVWWGPCCSSLPKVFLVESLTWVFPKCAWWGRC